LDAGDELSVRVASGHDTGAKAGIHSTDIHGFSEAIFAVTDLRGCTCAPRIKKMPKLTMKETTIVVERS
jgi:TnpA family transposase